MTSWNRRMQCLVAMATYITGEAKRAWPKRRGGNPACPVVWGVAVRFRHLPDRHLVRPDLLDVPSEERSQSATEECLIDILQLCASKPAMNPATTI